MKRLDPAALREAQAETLASTGMAYRRLSRILFATTDLCYGCARALQKFKRGAAGGGRLR